MTFYPTIPESYFMYSMYHIIAQAISKATSGQKMVTPNHWNKQKRSRKHVPVVFSTVFSDDLVQGVWVKFSGSLSHDDVIKWKHCPRYWPFVRGIHRWPVEALMFSLICSWINGWVNNGEAGDLRRHRGHYNLPAMFICLLTTLLVTHKQLWVWKAFTNVRAR